MYVFIYDNDKVSRGENLINKYVLRDKGNLKNFQRQKLSMIDKRVLEISHSQGILKIYFENCNSICAPIDPKYEMNTTNHLLKKFRTSQGTSG